MAARGLHLLPYAVYQRSISKRNAPGALQQPNRHRCRRADTHRWPCCRTPDSQRPFLLRQTRRQKGQFPLCLTEAATLPSAVATCYTIRKNQMRFDRITQDQNRMNGQLCIRDLRITVRRVLEILAACPDRQTIRQEYPELEDDDLAQALSYAATLLDDSIVDLRSVG